MPTKEELAEGLLQARIAKLVAEESKAYAEAEAIKLESEDKHAESLITRRQNLAFARKQEAGALVEENGAEMHRRQHVANLASDLFYQRYHFNDVVTPHSVQNCMAQLSLWSRTVHTEDGKPCPIEIVFTSGGGDITSGFVLYDFILSLRAKGHYVTTSVLGVAASMATLLLQAGDHRTMGRQAFLMFHEGSQATRGTMSQAEEQAKWGKEQAKQIFRVIGERAAATGRPDAVTFEYLEEKILKSKDDWYVPADEAFKKGFVDSILPYPGQPKEELARAD